MVSTLDLGRPWSRDGDARLSPVCSVGPHVVRIVDYSDPDLTQFSDIMIVDLVAGQTQDLEVHLRPGITVKGEVDAPKPVQNGVVIVDILDAAAGPTSTYDQCIQWQTWTTIDENGQFEFPSLPPTASLHDRLVRGYVCSQPRRSTVPPSDPVELERLPQYFSIDPDHPVCRVELEPCAQCEVSIVDSAGRPVEGLEASFYPNLAITQWASESFGFAGEQPRNSAPGPI